MSMKIASVIKCRCFQVKSSGKVRIFFLAIHLLHTCHVSDNRSRSIMYFYYIFFSLFALSFIMDSSSVNISL